LGDRLEHGLIRGQLQLAAHSLFVHAGALKRAGSIANRDHARHQSGDRRAVERIRGNELLDPLAFGCEIAPLTRLIGTAKQCVGVLAGQSCPGRGYPELEFRVAV
jgi:hypothetical protein